MVVAVVGPVGAAALELAAFALALECRSLLQNAAAVAHLIAAALLAAPATLAAAFEAYQ